MKVEQNRTHNQLRRILTLIDMLAGFSFPKTAKEIKDQLNEVTGTTHGQKTVERDLWLLESMGLVVLNGRRLTESKHGLGAYTFKLNMKRTERLQTVAIQLLDGDSDG